MNARKFFLWYKIIIRADEGGRLGVRTLEENEKGRTVFSSTSLLAL